MKSFPVYLVVLWVTFSSVLAASHHGLEALARHARMIQRGLETRTTPKRASCAAKHNTSASHSSSGSAAKSTAGAKSEIQQTSSSGSGVVHVKSTCGNIGALKTTSKTAGPNGSQSWLNCGIENGGWKPPHIGVGDLITVDLHTALKSSSSPFHQCSAYIGKFTQYANQYGIPPIIIASFALQESGCNPSTVGGGGEQGLMQLTHDKCGDAPGGNCKDVDYNIHTGTKYFKSLLDENGGNVPLCVGAYNGWYVGLTKKKAEAARYTDCCRCQNNLDYVHQMLNGWFQNINAYSANLGTYHNLDVCF